MIWRVNFYMAWRVGLILPVWLPDERISDLTICANDQVELLKKG